MIMVIVGRLRIGVENGIRIGVGVGVDGG